jgi:hypothetical protein
MIPVSLQVGHRPVPPQFGHFSWSELRETFRPVPKHRWQSPDPPQSPQRRPPASSSNTMDTPWKRFHAQTNSFDAIKSVIGAGCSVCAVGERPRSVLLLPPFMDDGGIVGSKMAVPNLLYRKCNGSAGL